MLIPSKFSGYKAGIRLYPGKSDPPPPPDYASAAKETAAGNREAAEYTTKANRINQVTPYGSLNYNYTPQYDASGKETGAGWTQTMNLTPQAQATLDKQMALSDKYADVAGIGFDKSRSIFEDPTLDESGVPERAIDVGQTAQEALLARLNPTLMNDEEALRTRLANQGIGLGSNAYTREMMLQGQRGNDLRLQAALQGINLDQANRAAALNEAYTKQSRPLDLINALRTGAQVQNPQFQGFYNQANVAGPDLLGATNQQYAQQMAGYNADQAANASMMSGLMGLGGAALLSPAGTFTGAGGLFSKLSDIRTKENIKQVGQLDNGLNVYEYTYKPEFDIPGIHVGVMAQEVIKVKPEAIVMRDDGYMAVNYAMI